mgnify:CR=1 FL=1
MKTGAGRFKRFPIHVLAQTHQEMTLGLCPQPPVQLLAQPVQQRQCVRFYDSLDDQWYTVHKIDLVFVGCELAN